MLLCYILFIYNDNPSIISIARPSGKQYLRNMLNPRSGDQNYYLKKKK